MIAFALLSLLVLPVARSQLNSNWTFVNDTGCLFYAKGISVVYVGLGKPATIVEVPIANTTYTHSGNCGGNNSDVYSTMEITFGSGPFTGGQLTITSLKLMFEFNATAAPFGDWSVSAFRVDMNYQDNTEKPPKPQTLSTSSRRKVDIGANRRFSYACTRPDIIWLNGSLSNATASSGGKQAVTQDVGIRFDRLQLQPFDFHYSGGKFSDDVDDCVPFFSVGVWMSLFAGLILILIFFFGISMITTLKTMDRFDDPKGKPLVINCKE